MPTPKKYEEPLTKSVQVRISATTHDRIKAAKSIVNDRIVKGELKLEDYREISDEMRDAITAYLLKLEQFAKNGHAMIDDD